MSRSVSRRDWANWFVEVQATSSRGRRADKTTSPSLPGAELLLVGLVLGRIGSSLVPGYCPGIKGITKRGVLVTLSIASPGSRAKRLGIVGSWISQVLTPAANSGLSLNRPSGCAYLGTLHHEDDVLVPDLGKIINEILRLPQEGSAM